MFKYPNCIFIFYLRRIPCVMVSMKFSKLIIFTRKIGYVLIHTFYLWTVQFEFGRPFLFVLGTVQFTI